jgi:hypothetical protein
VTLPKGQLLDNSHFNTICTRVQFNSDSCPAGSKIGSAVAQTPLLNSPLEGPVYLRSSSNKLPDLVLDLEGQVDFVAVAKIDSVNGRLRTTFSSVPDVPLGTVKLDLLGGSKGLLQNSENLCRKPRRAEVRMTGQNGVDQDFKSKLKVACGPTASHKRGSRR